MSNQSHIVDLSVICAIQRESVAVNPITTAGKDYLLKVAISIPVVL